MVWFTSVLTLLILVLQSRSLWKKRLWPDLWSQMTLLGIGVAAGAAVSLHWWTTIDVLAPVKAVFTPISEWIYSLL